MRWLCLAAVLSAAVAVAAEPVTVRVFRLPDKSLSTGVFRGQAEALDVFRAQHPNIRLEQASQLQIEGHTMDTGVLLAIAGGVSPDVIYVNFRQSDSYIQQGFLAPLDDYIAKLPPGAFEERVAAPVRPVIRRKGPPDGKEHVYALPYTMIVSTMIYRKDLFAGAGLDPERPPQTWDELLAYGQKLTNPEKGVYGLGFAQGAGELYSLFSFLSSAGAQAVTQQPDGSWRATFDTPAAVDAYYFCWRLLNCRWNFKGRPMKGVCYSGTDLWDKWAQGKIAMLTVNYLSENQLTEENPELCGFAPPPRGPTGLSSAEINCLMMGIFAGQKDKRVRDAAWDYLWFIDSPAARRIVTRYLVESGNAQLVNPLYLQRYGYPDLVSQVPKGLAEIFDFAVKHGTPEPYGKNCQLVYDYLAKPLEEIRDRDFTGLSEPQIKAAIAGILKRTVAETNEKMIGYLPPQQQHRRNAVAWAVVILVAASFILIFRRIRTTFRAGVAGGQWGFRKYKWAYIVLLPAALLILTWQYYPLARGSLIAFQDYMIVGRSRWVGLENFANALFDAEFRHSFLCSLYFMMLWMALGFFPPILLAVLLQEVPRGKALFRTLYYLPAVVTGVVVLFLWKEFYDPSAQGLLNQLLHFFHVSPQNWLQNPRLAMLCVVVPLAWMNLGPGCIIYLAALKSVPEELYEAAEIDGAGFRRKVTLIALPYLKPLLIINFVGAFIGAFKSVDFILAMTGGGPAGATNVVGMQIFNQSFLDLKFGLATAMAWILGSLLLGFTALQLRTLSRVEFRTAKA